MKNLLFIIFLSLKVIAQNDLTENQIEDLSQNIIAFSIKYSDNENYKDFFPKTGWQLNLKINKLTNVNIGNKNMVFYEVLNDNFSFKKINGNMETQKTFSHDTPLYFKLSRLSLIAVNDKNEVYI